MTAKHWLTPSGDIRPYAEIGISDVGRPMFRAFGRVWLTSGFIGTIKHYDVGKRVYLVGDSFLQVENSEQFEFRKASR